MQPILQCPPAQACTTEVAERARLERDLHDGAQQRLVTLLLHVKLSRRQLRADEATGVLLDRVEGQLGGALVDLRALTTGGRPDGLETDGLSRAVERLAERSHPPARVTAMIDRRLPGPVEAVAYFFIAEALANVAKHASASSVDVFVTRDRDVATVRVSDDGIGGADLARGSGLRGLERRIRAVGGSFRCESRPGDGTRVTAEIPCAS